MISKHLRGRAAKVSSTGGQIAFSAFAQLVRYGAPLLFYPILIRTVAPEEFAAFVLYYAAGQTIGQFTEFGFGLTAVRALTQADDNAGKGALACGQVLCGKLLMFLVSIFVFLIAYFIYIGDQFHYASFLLPVLVGLSYGFTPNWYYIGIRRAHVLATGEILVSAAQLLLVLLLVHKDSGALTIVAAMSVPVLALSMFGQIAALHRLSFQTPSRDQLVEAFRAAYHFFVASNASALANRLFVLVLGSSATATQIAYYAAGERLVSAAVNTLTPVMRVLIPNATVMYAKSPDEAFRWFRRVSVALTGLYAGGALLVAATAYWWVPFVFGSSFSDAVTLIAVFLLAIPMAAASRVIGLLYLVPAEMESLYQKVTLTCCVVGLLGIIPAAQSGAMGVVILRLVVELGILMGCIGMLLKVRRRVERRQLLEG